MNNWDWAEDSCPLDCWFKSLLRIFHLDKSMEQKKFCKVPTNLGISLILMGGYIEDGCLIKSSFKTEEEMKFKVAEKILHYFPLNDMKFYLCSGQRNFRSSRTWQRLWHFRRTNQWRPQENWKHISQNQVKIGLKSQFSFLTTEIQSKIFLKLWTNYI